MIGWRIAISLIALISSIFVSLVAMRAVGGSGLIAIYAIYVGIGYGAALTTLVNSIEYKEVGRTCLQAAMVIVGSHLVVFFVFVRWYG